MGGGSTGHFSGLRSLPVLETATGTRLRPTSRLPFSTEPLMHFDRFPTKELTLAFSVPLRMTIVRAVQSRPKYADKIVPSKCTDMLSASRTLAL